MLSLLLSHATTQKRLKDEVASVSAERTAYSGAIQNRDTIIADLRLQFHGHNQHRFGSKSESSEQLALELILKELEVEQAAETDDEDVMEELEYVPDITS
jgi:transposase